jgi:transposase
LVSPNAITEEHMGVIIGVDPHKGSHTGVAVDRDETQLAKVKVRATRHQVDQLLRWASGFEERTWAIESAGGLGYLLAQQLVGAGERVVDVPATPAGRVRVLGTGRSNKNDPSDALVAVAALRAPRLASVARADSSGVLRLLAKRNTDLGRARNKTACRLHALLAELVPGGIPHAHRRQAPKPGRSGPPRPGPRAPRRPSPRTGRRPRPRKRVCATAGPTRRPSVLTWYRPVRDFGH